jgi:hypothetical protein
MFTDVVSAENASFEEGVVALKTRIDEHHADNKKSGKRGSHARKEICGDAATDRLSQPSPRPVRRTQGRLERHSLRRRRDHTTPGLREQLTQGETQLLDIRQLKLPMYNAKRDGDSDVLSNRERTASCLVPSRRGKTERISRSAREVGPGYRGRVRQRPQSPAFPARALVASAGNEAQPRGSVASKNRWSTSLSTTR